MTAEPSALQLDSFRVRMYRSIRDSGIVPVFPLTALVGRHPSGKTSLLHALRGLDPRRLGPFSLTKDWPRGTSLQRAEQQVACCATFRLGDAAREALSGAGVVDGEARGFRLARSYDGTLSGDVWSGDRPAHGLTNDTVGMTPVSDASWSSIWPWVREHLPTFLYADHDSFLPGAISIETLANPGPRDEENGVAALARLLAGVGVGPGVLREEPGPRPIREAGERIRAKLNGLGGHHDLALDVARGRVLVFLESGGVRTALDEASKELRYVLTLDVRLAATAGGDGGAHALLLLDAPGRSFRRQGRARMRARFESYLRAGATVLYTSRLPFEIELQHPEQVLVLEPASEGAMVHSGASGEGEQLALRAALGMTGRTSFGVDDLNLVVEGPTDLRILNTLSELLRRSGERGLPADVNLLSAQGSYEVATISTFLARQGLAVIAFLDSDSAGVTADEKLRRDLGNGGQRVVILQLAQAAGLPAGQAAIEDLFPIEYYLRVADEVCGADEGPWLTQTLADEKLHQRGNPAFRLSKAFEGRGRHFPKGKVIEALDARLAAMHSVAELPQGMLGPVRHLMRTLGSTADRLRAPALPSSG